MKKEFTNGEWTFFEAHILPGHVHVLAIGNESQKRKVEKHIEGDVICSISPVENLEKVDYANAKLISAAPDLLEALQEVIKISDRNHIAWDKAKAAIKKATS